MNESETTIHENIAKYLNLVIRKPSRWWTIEVSNQASGKAAMIRQMALKRRGVTTGTPDIQVKWRKSSGELHLIFMEVKALDGKLTEKQAALHQELREEGHSVFVVRSVADAENALVEVGMLRR